MAGSEAYSQLNTQSSAVNGLPSCHLTPFFSFQVTDLPSLASAAVLRVGDLGGEDRHEVAVGVPPGERLVEDARAVLVLGADGEMRI